MSKVCRLCLTKCERDDVTIYTTFSRWEEKTVWDVVTEMVALKQLDRDPLPKRVCLDCFMKLDQYYEFHEQILLADKSLKDECNAFISKNVQVKLEEDNKAALKEEFDNVDENNDQNEPLDEPDNIDETNTKKEIFYYEAAGQNTLENTTKTEEVNDTDSKDPWKKTLPTRKKYKVKPQTKKQINRKRQKIVRKCVHCNKTFNRKGCFDSHMLKHYGKASFACEFCPKRFIRSVGLVYHRRTHTGEKPYKCSICSKDFKTPSELHAHKKTHSSEKHFKCNECEATFRSNECLKNHIRRHTGERPFLCEICSKGFVSRAMLATHIKTAHNEKETCPICQKQITPLGLKKHIQRHKNQEEGIKNYTCELCGKGFSESATRRKHMLIHTGEKPFACEVCGKRFTQKSTLSNHSRVHSDVLPFPCNFCEKGFRYKHHLRNHMTVHHKDMQAHNTASNFDNDSSQDALYHPFIGSALEQVENQ